MTARAERPERESWLHRLTEPHPAVEDPRDRRQARLLAALLLVLTPLSLVATTFGPLLAQALGSPPGDPAIVWIGAGILVLLAVAYGLSRSPDPELGALVLVAVSLLAVFGGAFSNPVAADRPASLAFLALPVVLAGLFLPLRYVVATAALALGGIWGYRVLDPAVHPASLIVPALLVVFVASLVLLSERMRRAPAET